MSDQNLVEVTVAARDNTGPGLASATAKEQAFARLMDQTTRKEIAAATAAGRAEDVRAKAWRALGDAAIFVRDEEAKAGVVERELANRAQDAADRHGFLRTALDGVGRAALSLVTSGLAGLVQSLGQLPGIIGMFVADAGPATVALGALAGAAAAAAVSLTPLIAALGLITVGIGGFALVAAPEISKVFSALTQHGKQLHNTLKNMSPAERELVHATQPLRQEFHKLQQAIQPEIIKAFAQAIRILKELFPAIRPLIVAAGKALDGFLKNIAGWLNGPSGKKFIAWMQTEGPRAIATFGRALWTAMKVAGTVFDTLYKVAERVDFGWRNFIHGMAQLLDLLRTTLIGVGHTFESVWNTVVGVVEGAANAIEGAVSRITSALSSVNSALGGIPGKILGALGLASGGIAGAASGGLRSGLKLVGEQGPELVQMPAGSRVYNNSQTEQMLSGAGGGVLRVQLEWAGGAAGDEFLTWLRKQVRIRAGGDVQRALGRV